MEEQILAAQTPVDPNEDYVIEMLNIRKEFLDSHNMTSEDAEFQECFWHVQNSWATTHYNQPQFQSGDIVIDDDGFKGKVISYNSSANRNFNCSFGDVPR